MKFTNNRPVSAPGGGRRSKQPFRYAMTPPPEPPAPPPPDLGAPTTAMITFADDWQALAEPTHAGMFRDEAHQQEMLAMTGTIATRAACDYVAVQDGDWTDTTTWLRRSDNAFAVPVTGAKIGIPAGITVNMNNNTTTVFDTLRVDGKVTFPVNQNTKLYIDTIVVNHGGEWLHGTVASPIPAAYTSEIVFPNQTNLDGAKGKLLLQRGFLGMGANSMHPDGKIHIHGASKDHWATTSATVAAGATSVVLDAAPTGWAVGDSIHLMATEVQGYVNNSRAWADPPADNVTITGFATTNVANDTVQFTPATTYEHSPDSRTGMTDLKWYVVNFTRNVKYYSPVDTPIHQRGHWMGMGDGIDVRWASFDWLGRTNKKLDTPSFDATNDAARIAENGGVGDPDFTPTDNVRGRYNFHVHRSGVGIGQAYATVTGISCTESPGWLIAHHQSNANFTKCVGRSFLGSGMIAEVGSEAGKWLDCFMGEGKQIDRFAGTQSDKGESGSVGVSSVYGPYIDQFGVNRKYVNDFGRNNNCFWFKGRAVEVDGLISAGAGRGMVWSGRGNAAGQNPTVANLPYDARIFYGREQEAQSVGSDAPVLLVKNCLVVGVDFPLMVIKSRPNQNHNFRTHIHSCDFWRNGSAIQFEYTAHYTMDNCRIARTTKSLQNAYVAKNAISLTGAAADFYISNNVVQGYADAVVDKAVTDTQFPTYDHGNVVLDNHTTNSAALVKYTGDDIPDKTISLRLEDPAGISVADPTWTPSAEPVFPNYTSPQGPSYIFVGPLTTELDTRDRQHETTTSADIASLQIGLSSRFDSTGLGLMLSRYGYYTYTHPTHGASNYLLVPDVISKKLPPTPGADIPVRYLTVPVRLTGVSLGDYIPQGALPQRYVDCIALGDPGISDPGSPAAGAAAYVVYEDILGVGGLYEGL